MRSKLTQILDYVPTKWLVGLAFVVVAVILIFGLRPRGYNFDNNIQWIQDHPGIRFGKYGVAFTSALAGRDGKAFSDAAGFSLELAFKLESYHTEGFSFILSLHNGDDQDQLLVGQWRSSIVVMNGDDYDHKRKVARITLDETSPLPVMRFLTLTTGAKGTKAYLDGRLVRGKKGLKLKIPPGDHTRLVLANSVYGRHPWRGEIYGLAMYPQELSSKEVSRHFFFWSRQRNFLFGESDDPCLLYVFDEKQGTRTQDHSRGDHLLSIPSKMRILKKEVLWGEAHGLEMNRMLIQDIAINLLGFIPFGFVLAATLTKLGGRYRRHGLWIAVSLGFSISLTIEIAQAWMPSRSSQLLDLVLNTMGTWVGAAGCRFFFIGSRKQGLTSE